MSGLIALALLLAGCTPTATYEGTWDVPIASAVLQNEVGGPFSEPIGYVASEHGGQIGLLELKQGQFLVDSPDGPSFFRTAPLATGDARLLSGVAVYGRDDGTVTVYAIDRAFDQLLIITHVFSIDADGNPTRVEASVSEPPTYTGTGTAEMSTVTVKTGFTSTEDWTVAYSGTDWTVTGSRSGVQELPAQTGVAYSGNKRDVNFTITGEPATGDRFEFRTESGLVEVPLDATPLYLSMSPDQSRLALVTRDSDGQDRLQWVDPNTGGVQQTVTLAEGAQPGRLSWSDDSSSLFVADNALSAVWEVQPARNGVIEHHLPWPVFDVAPMISDGARLLYVAPGPASAIPSDDDAGREVWVYNLDTGDFVDINTWIPGVQGMTFNEPVDGIEPIRIPYLFLERDDDGVRKSGRTVAVSTAHGRVVFMKEGSGCLVDDASGPRTNLTSNSTGYDYITSFQSNVAYAATMEQNVDNDRHVLVNPCGGIAKAQRWILHYDETMQAWQVKGSSSGLQNNLAYEDQRYLSDQGEISFVIRSGSTPSQDGWWIQFDVLDGTTTADGDDNKDGTREVSFDLPSDPTYFHYTVGPHDTGWQTIDDRAFVLVTAPATDVAARIKPQDGKTEVVWQ